MPTHEQTSIRSGLLLSLRVLIANLTVALAIVAALVLAVATAAHAEGGCPNEQLREENHSTALPDCRAYELVSPPFEGGDPPAENAVSASGEVFFTNLAGFGEPGDDSSVEGTEYVAKRETGGWASEPLEPSAADFEGAPGNSAEDVSSKRRQILSLRVPASAKSIDKRFYISEPGGAVAEVGPTIPPTELAGWSGENLYKNERPLVGYKGASPDLSHIFFQSVQRIEPIDFLWPGDEGVASESLYEYVGTGHAGGPPQLVGVSDGTTKVHGVTLPAGALISQCGTILGGIVDESEEPYEEYNAISEESAGSEAGVIKEEAARVFFTAKAGGCVGKNRAEQAVIGSGPNIAELYARINGLRTIDISEPSAGDCSLCDISEADQPGAQDLGPTFVGASRTGSKVFFTTTQKLFPAQGDGVNLYEYDFSAPAGAKVSLVGIDLAGAGELHGGVMRVSEDGSHIYFVSTAKLAGNLDAKGEAARQSEKVGGKEEVHDNLYVYDTDSGTTRFIAELASADANDWQPFDTRQADATPDGNAIVFASVNDLTPGASGRGVQLYRYEAGTDSLTRVTVGENGMNDDGNNPAMFTAVVTPQYSSLASAAPQPTSISENGSIIAFESSLALTSGALDNVCVPASPEGECIAAVNVYEYEDGHVYLISDGQDTHGFLEQSATQLIGLTPSGTDLFFKSSDQLVPSDTDTQQDIYDARVGGGYPAPVKPVECAGECQGSGGNPPAFGAPASATLTGAGNLPAPAVVPAVKVKPKPKAETCKKGFVKKKGKCVKRVGKRSKTAKRAGNNRRGK